MAVKKEEQDIKVEPVKYSKGQILQAERFRDHRDIIGVVLDDNDTYYLDDVCMLVDSFLRREVR